MENKNTIVIIGGGLKKDGDKWHTTNYDEGDNFGVQGDRLRVVAANYLYKDDPGQTIIALGGKGQLINIPDAPTVSEAIKKELMELGVPAEQIIKEENSGNSWQQLMELKKIIYPVKSLREAKPISQGEEKGLGNIKIISNEYHLARLKAMAGLDDLLKEKIKNKNIEFQSAEEILLKYNSEEWEDKIKKAYKSEAMKERIVLEENGVRDIKEGKYKLK